MKVLHQHSVALHEPRTFVRCVLEAYDARSSKCWRRVVKVRGARLSSMGGGRLGRLIVFSPPSRLGRHAGRMASLFVLFFKP